MTGLLIMWVCTFVRCGAYSGIQKERNVTVLQPQTKAARKSSSTHVPDLLEFTHYILEDVWLECHDLT